MTFSNVLEVISYEDMTDEQIIESIRNGSDEALEYLMSKYQKYVNIKARAYFLIGADRDDVIQEGLIGLYKAIRDFRYDKFSSFRTFAEICITRQIITAIKTATRQKHIPLNSYISLNKPIYEEDNERTLLDMIEEKEICNPEQILINNEEIKVMEEKMEKVLSKLEWQVLNLYIEGKTYQEIGLEINKDEKCIDNALQRVKRKLYKQD